MIKAVALLGLYLNQHVTVETSQIPELSRLNSTHFDEFEGIIKSEHIYNPWFTEANIRLSLEALSASLEPGNIDKWLNKYPGLPANSQHKKTVGVIMAGNIPMVGFHDMISVLLSGNHFLGKLSSKDDRLLKKVVDILVSIEDRFKDRIEFTEGYLKNINAIIATGSDNSSRYFEYYFKDLPHIIRRNRNGIAILNGTESKEDLHALGRDIFSYFGLGCRNVTKIYIPENYNLEIFLGALESFPNLSEHNKYNNNLDYNRSVYLMNQIPFLDNGLLLIREETKIASPVGVVFYEKYLQLDRVIEEIQLHKDQVQCIATVIEGIENSIRPGESQFPKLWDYADGIDTMEFLTDLSK